VLVAGALLLGAWLVATGPASRRWHRYVFDAFGAVPSLHGLPADVTKVDEIVG
jgi:hypothetical protein